MSIIKLGDSTWDEINKLDKQNTVIIIPTGSIEQHGPHLPLKTDSFIISEIAFRSAQQAEKINKLINFLILPVISIGRSPHHLDFIGSLSLSSSTFINTIEEICTCLFDYKFKRIILFNGHGGNEDCLKVATRNIRDKINILVCFLSYWSFITDEINELRQSSNGGICHAGEMETSMMLYLDKDSVRRKT